jgi:hypothetical protein
MEKLRISKTVYPDVKFNSFHEWAKIMWADFKIDMNRNLSGWEKNIYIPKKK